MVRCSSIGLLSDLKGELASLRIDRDRPAAPRLRRWPLLLFLPVVLVLGVLYAIRARQALAAPEVETARATVVRQGEASAGAPILTASGYVVARRKAVVSAKIQGRLAELRVEEGSRVRQNDVIARLESQDYEAQVQRARAALQRAEADLAESQRQLDLARRLTAEKIMSTDQQQTAESRTRVNEAAVSQARADVNGAPPTNNSASTIRSGDGGVASGSAAAAGGSVGASTSQPRALSPATTTSRRSWYTRRYCAGISCGPVRAAMPASCTAWNTPESTLVLILPRPPR